jgi:metal-dependent HD superfamily phosphatase/phosphodiesterase
MRSGPVPGDHLGGRQRLVALLGGRERAVQFGLQPVEGFTLDALLVATDQITDVLADILVGAVLADIGRDVVRDMAISLHHVCSR